MCARHGAHAAPLPIIPPPFPLPSGRRVQTAMSSNHGSRVTGLRPRICQGAVRNGVGFHPCSFFQSSMPCSYSRCISSAVGGFFPCTLLNLDTAPWPSMPPSYAFSSFAQGSRSVLIPRSAGGHARCGVSFHAGSTFFGPLDDAFLRGGELAGRLIISLSSATSASSAAGSEPAGSDIFLAGSGGFFGRETKFGHETKFRRRMC